MRRLKARVLSIKSVTPTVIDLSVARTSGRDFWGFEPGQYATISFPTHGRLNGERSFSIASSATDRSVLRFGIRVMGRYTQALRRVAQGDPVYVGGPFGQFTFDKDRDRYAVFFAGGIGITPFLSMIRTSTKLRLENEIILFYSVRSIKEAAYREELDRMQEINPRFHVIYAIGDGKLPKSNEYMIPGRFNDDIIADVLDKTYAGRSYFFCGPPPFMGAMRSILEMLGVEPLHLFQERFSVGSSKIFERGTPIPKYVMASWGIATMALFGFVYHAEHERRENTNAALNTLTTTPTSSLTTNAPIQQEIPRPSTPTSTPTTTVNTSTPSTTTPTPAPTTTRRMPRTMLS